MSEISEKLTGIIHTEESWEEVSSFGVDVVVNAIKKNAPSTAKRFFDRFSEEVKKAYKRLFDDVHAITRIALEEAYSDEEIEKLIVIYSDNPWMIKKSMVYASVVSSRMSLIGERASEEAMDAISDEFEDFNIDEGEDWKNE